MSFLYMYAIAKFLEISQTMKNIKKIKKMEVKGLRGPGHMTRTYSTMD